MKHTRHLRSSGRMRSTMAVLAGIGLLIGAVTAFDVGTAAASVDAGISVPDGATNVDPSGTYAGNCSQTGAGAVVDTCSVSFSDSGGNVLADDDINVPPGSNLVPWGPFPLFCSPHPFTSDLYIITVLVTGTGGGIKTVQSAFHMPACTAVPPNPPTATIGGPPDGTTYVPGIGTPPVFTGSCGSDATSSSVTVTKPDGSSVASGDGATLPVDQLGDYTVTISCTGPGGTNTSTTHYSVHNTPPTATITSPPDGSKGPDGRSFYLNEGVIASYTCADVDGNLTSCVGDVGSGSAIDTGSTGANDLHVTATDAFGATGTADSGYTVYRRPEAHITSPADGLVFTPGQDPTPTFHGACQLGIPDLSCSSTVQHWSAGSATPIADGDSVPTSPYGRYTLHTHASDARPTTADAETTVRANRPPTAVVSNTPATPTTFATGPQVDKRYFVGQTVYASYACGDTEDTPGVAVSVTSCVGDVANGAPIDTATVGHKSFTVTAIDNDGGTTVVTIPYTVHPVVGPCRGSAARVLGINLGVANEPANPCVATDKSTVVVSGLGTLLGIPLNGINAGVLTASTAKGVGSQTATATVTNANIGVPGVGLNIKALTSTATARLYDCDASALTTYADEIAGFTVNGTPIKVTNVPLAINLVVGTLYLNQVVKVDGAHGGSTITVRPINLDLAGPLPDVAVGEVIAGAECGPLPT